ncbi:hypothetical protein BG015_011644 [Linnemannia schmuckeri]|uniref:N-acetyltransferase domain-containing protein n=1 Tax=Linnemannia schmuckeri TaxID=64567 RepID=A0A9P5V880_9FUNG|nr:hypothetical protein BG015_011644 [Linnemannia schmuckeri]
MTTTTTTPPNPKQGKHPAPPIRCLGPFQISPTIYLTPIYISDAPEQHRILNLNDSFFKGLYSDSMIFPFPEGEALRFSTFQEEERAKQGVCQTWAIRTTVNGPMIGLFSLEPQDHREMGPCYLGKGLVLNAMSTQRTDSNDKGEGGDDVPLNCGGIGYWLSPEHAGKCIMTDVLKFALTHLARREFGYDRVHGESWSDNNGSTRVMERAGMLPVIGLPIFVPKFNATKDVAHFIYDIPSDS